MKRIIQYHYIHDNVLIRTKEYEEEVFKNKNGEYVIDDEGEKWYLAAPNKLEIKTYTAKAYNPADWWPKREETTTKQH